MRTSQVAMPLFVMLAGCLGSLHAVERLRGSRVFKGRSGRWAPPSEDTLGRVTEKIDPDEIRRLIAATEAVMRRNRALPHREGQLRALVLDGHEFGASYRRKSDASLCRRVKTQEGEKIQYYHRYVAAGLLGEGYHHFLDLEWQRNAGDEAKRALDLFERVDAAYSRAFDVVMGDALYAQAPFINAVLGRGKDVLVVLKQEDRDFYKEAERVFAEVEPRTIRRGKTRCVVWDVEGFATWAGIDRPLRVIKSVETTEVRRQDTGKIEEVTRTWMWVTTIPKRRLRTEGLLDLAHERWSIENCGFNAAVNVWGLDHVYRMEPNAMQVILLLGMLAMNLFEVFYRRNLKPELRRRVAMCTIIQWVTAEIVAACSPDTS